MEITRRKSGTTTEVYLAGKRLYRSHMRDERNGVVIDFSGDRPRLVRIVDGTPKLAWEPRVREDASPEEILATSYDCYEGGCCSAEKAEFARAVAHWAFAQTAMMGACMAMDAAPWIPGVIPTCLAAVGTAVVTWMDVMSAMDRFFQCMRTQCTASTSPRARGSVFADRPRCEEPLCRGGYA